MQWSKAIIAGAVGGVANAVYSFIMHGLIMGNTYQSRPEVFRQDTNPVWYPIVAILLGVVAGLFFARSRSAWSAGVKGGVNFGLWLGLVGFAATFYDPLIFAGFPYFLTWCWGAITLIGWLVYGAVAGAMYKA